jgi:hypothetical protein
VTTRASRQIPKSSVRASGFHLKLSRRVVQARFSRAARIALLDAVQTASEASTPRQTKDDSTVTAWLGAPPSNPAELEFKALQARFAMRRELLQQCIGITEVATLLGLDNRHTPLDRIKAGTLLAIRDQGQWRFPLWQFDPDGPDGVIDGLPQILAALSVSELAKVRWLQRPQAVFSGCTPIQLLKEGQLERVLTEASAVGCGQD